jgi:hypothetical protein
MKIEFIETCTSETKLPKFIVEKANWQLFADHLDFASISRDSIDTMVEDFAKCIINAAEISFPYT